MVAVHGILCNSIVIVHGNSAIEPHLKGLQFVNTANLQGPTSNTIEKHRPDIEHSMNLILRLILKSDQASILLNLRGMLVLDQYGFLFLFRCPVFEEQCSQLVEFIHSFSGRCSKCYSGVYECIQISGHNINLFFWY